MRLILGCLVALLLLLIAQTLQAAGFDVVGARDLDQDSLRRAFRDFLEKATSSGPDTVAFVYLSGYGLQLEGENYFVPADAKIGRDADVAAEAVRVSDYIRSLAALKLKASIVVLDAARRSPFAVAGQPLAGGLALVEPSPGMLVAFNAAPGTIASEQNGSYGAYAHALAEMIREGGLSLGELFDRVRLRVNEPKGRRSPGTPQGSTRLSRSLSVRPMRPRRSLRPISCRRFARGRSATWTPRTPMWRRSSATRCKATRNFLPPIPTIPWPSGCVP